MHRKSSLLSLKRCTNPDFYVYRERRADERFPWDFINQGTKKSCLQREYQRAMQGRTIADCQVETFRICGVCMGDQLEDRSV